jgi:RNA polymerase sigma-70 factor (ECF subfamily)
LVDGHDVTETPAAEPSFEKMYRRLAPGIVGYLRANGVDDPEAIMQEVFISVLPKIGKISGGEDGARTLLFSIAHARVVDHHRHRGRISPAIEYDPQRDGRSMSSAEEVAADRSRDESTMAILSSLKADHREVLLLRVVADLPLVQVAMVMGKSVGSVKQLQRRALLALSEHPDLTKGALQ